MMCRTTFEVLLTVAISIFSMALLRSLKFRKHFRDERTARVYQFTKNSLSMICSAKKWVKKWVSLHLIATC
jgi:hypothetical protein